MIKTLLPPGQKCKSAFLSEKLTIVFTSHSVGALLRETTVIIVRYWCWHFLSLWYIDNIAQKHLNMWLQLWCNSVLSLLSGNCMSESQRCHSKPWPGATGAKFTMVWGGEMACAQSVNHGNTSQLWASVRQHTEKLLGGTLPVCYTAEGMC